VKLILKSFFLRTCSREPISFGCHEARHKVVLAQPLGCAQMSNGWAVALHSHGSGSTIAGQLL